MFNIEIDDTSLAGDLFPGYLAVADKRAAANWAILRRLTVGERAIYEVVAAGYSKTPDQKIFEKEDIDVRPNDGHYVFFGYGAKKAKLIKALSQGLRLESHSRLRDGDTRLLPAAAE